MNVLIRWGAGHPVRVAAGEPAQLRGDTRMSYLECDALMNYESEARSGRPDALYSLGLAYSTGQGAGVDYVAAHKWFNLAALKGVDDARACRAHLSRERGPLQNAESPPPAPEWRATGQ